ncbi:hypothetical protein HPB50_028955 [Hyalomma asiaticum]|nr:hypothetical protein HPB50_028955 [Hyalomma asiaticum]
MAGTHDQKEVLLQLSRYLVQKIDRWEGRDSAMILGSRILDAKKPGAFVLGDGRPLVAFRELQDELTEMAFRGSERVHMDAL